MIYVYIGVVCIIYNRFLMVKMFNGNERRSKIKQINLSLIPLYLYILYDLIKYLCDLDIFKKTIESLSLDSGLLLLAVLISLIIGTVLLKYSYLNVYEGNMWGEYKNSIFSDKKMGLILFVLVILVGMIGAGIVNFFTTTESERLSGFVIGGITGLCGIFLGYWLIMPQIAFWYKYKHLKDFSTDLGDMVHILNKKSRAYLNLTPGIQSIELFEVKEITSANEIEYNINNIWENKNKNSDVGKFIHNTTKVNMDFLHKFFKSFDPNGNLPIDILNEYSSKGKENTMSIVYLNALVDFLNEISLELDKDFDDWVKGWNINPKINDDEYRYRSINYLMYFKPIKPLVIHIGKTKGAQYKGEKLFQGEENISFENFSDHIYLRNKIGGDSNKKYRQYYNFYFEVIHHTEGRRQFVLLFTVDSRLIEGHHICQVCETMLK